MRIIEIDQNTPEWYEERIGRFTASNMSMIITPTGKQSTSAEKYVTEIISGIISGKPSDDYSNKHMERGKTMEEEAADYYAMVYGVEPKKIGFCVSDDDIMGCSPDRFIGEDGILEIKTCISRIMVEQYEKETLEQDHRPQTQASLLVCQGNRKWIDTMLYSPGMKPIIRRSQPNTSYLMDMSRFLRQAHTSLHARLSDLRAKGFIDESSNKFIRGKP